MGGDEIVGGDGTVGGVVGDVGAIVGGSVFISSHILAATYDSVQRFLRAVSCSGGTIPPLTPTVEI